MKADSRWQSVNNGVPQGSILEPILFNIINDLDGRIECTFSKFSDDKNVEGGFDTSDGSTALQKTLTGWRSELEGVS